MSQKIFPATVDLLGVTDGYLVPPLTSVYALQFNTITDITVEYRYDTIGPWLQAFEGDFLSWCPAIQTGIFLRVTTIGASPAGVAQYSSIPDGLSVE